LKTILTNARLLALLLTIVVLATACGGDGGQQGSKSDGNKKEAAEKGGGKMAGMDHDQMGHSSTAMDSGGTARQMVLESGKYSDEAFIDAMVSHHRGAISMAYVALGNAEHEEIEELSRNIVFSQQAEIEELKAIRKEEFGTSRVPKGLGRMKGMMMDPQQLAKRESFDRAFIKAMIPHHQSAIEMAAVANEKSENPRIKELAENIISAQKREIEQMKRWREQWYPEG
jgi:uncharacterized protein (DUF305 family)